MNYNNSVVEPDPSLHNSDLAPLTKESKNWNWWTYSALWMGIAHNVPAWVVASNLLNKGFSFWQALGAVCIAYGIVYIAIILNSVSGTKYGIPFPVIIRSAFGYKAAHIPVFIRAFLGIFWFGVFMYIGSEAINIGLSAMSPTWAALDQYQIIGMGLNELISYIIAIAIHFYLVTHTMERIRKFEVWAGPIIMLLAFGMAAWAIYAANGIAPLVSIPSTITDEGSWGVFFLNVTALIGTMGTLILNNPDLSRFAKSQKDQIVGQTIGVLGMYVLYSVIALLTTAGTMVVFGNAITDPIIVLSHFHPAITVIGSFLIFVAVLSVNAASNAVAIGYDLTSLFPKKLDFGKSGVIGIFVGIFAVPWLWYGDSQSIDTIVGALAATMGPITGIMLADFYLIRSRKLDVNSLFQKNGIYSFKEGVNYVGLIAMGLGFLAAFIGLIIPSLSFLYSYNWFLGLGVGGLSYTILMWKRRSNQGTEIADLEFNEIGMKGENI